MRLLIIHQPSDRDQGRLRRLVRYGLKPMAASKGKERVLGVIDGLHFGKEGVSDPADFRVPDSIDLIGDQIQNDVPAGRRLYRHVIFALAAEAGEDLKAIPLSAQLNLLNDLMRRYAAIWAPDHPFIGIAHGDHREEDGRGIHGHGIFGNSDAHGNAIDWSRADLSSQQSMNWASGLGVVPTRGTGVKREKGTKMPYPKSETLDTKQIGELSNEQLENLITIGRIKISRRDKDGVLRSVKLDGRTIRLSTARALVARERGLAASRPSRQTKASSPSRNGIVHRVDGNTARPQNKQPTGWANFLRPRRLGYPAWGSPVDGSPRGKSKSRRRAVRSARRKLVSLIPTLNSLDKLGRKL